MDGVRRKREEWLTVRMSLQDHIDMENLPVHQACDWLGDPLVFGILIFSPQIYQAMHEEARRRANGDPSSGIELETAQS